MWYYKLLFALLVQYILKAITLSYVYAARLLTVFVMRGSTKMQINFIIVLDIYVRSQKTDVTVLKKGNNILNINQFNEEKSVVFTLYFQLNSVTQ